LAYRSIIRQYPVASQQRCPESGFYPRKMAQKVKAPY
jgi:hypothetical protein